MSTRGVQHPSTLAVIGDAVIRLPPDRPVLVLGIHSAGQSASEALGDNDAKMQNVGGILRRFGLGAEQMTTTGPNLIPTDGAAGPTTAPPATGMDASAALQAAGGGHLIAVSGHNALSWIKLSLHDTGRLGEILDAAQAAGVNLIHSISLDYRDESTVRQAALEAAGRDARSKAEALAKAMGRRLGDLLSIDEELVAPHPFDPAHVAIKVGLTTVAPGELPISARVRATYQLD
jgi:uncharacterized protein YggE